MNCKHPFRISPIAFGLVILLSTIIYPLSTSAQGTAFTYQGRLNDSNGPVNGQYDLRFTLYDQLGGASAPFDFPDLYITNGLFTVTPDFGNLFNGDSRSLEIAIRPAFTFGAYSPLSPRQPITPAPYAIFANTASNLSGRLPATQLTGTIANSLLPSNPNFSGTATAAAFSGSGANLTSLNANNISSGTLADARLSANVALRVGGNTFTNTQTFNGAINLNSSGGFGQSSVGNFYIDAPFVGGGRFAVLENGNVGIGIATPSQKLQVNGAATVTGLTVNGVATMNGAVNLPTAATINAGSDTILRSDANQNFFAGSGAGKNATIAVNNTALGYQAFYQSTNGQFNTAVGNLALFSNTTGSHNAAGGALALYSNTSGGPNTAFGYGALFSSAVSVNNTALGYQALFSDGGGNQNTAVGHQALFSNNSSYNSAEGYQALYSNSSGSRNTANGDQALYSNNSGGDNTAIGYQALYLHRSGDGNVAVGVEALYSNTNGSRNVAVGEEALLSSTSGSFNIAIGEFAGANIVTGTDNIMIGNEVGATDESGTIRIGRQYSQTRAFIGGIYNAILPNWTQVYVSSDGQLGTIASSARFKQNIQDMSDTSDVLLALRPVTFEYKPDIDPRGRRQFGLIAEEVEKINPDLVVHDQENGVYTVRYDAVNAMLLNEFLKQHKIVVEQNAQIADLKTRLERLEQIINSK